MYKIHYTTRVKTVHDHAHSTNKVLYQALIGSAACMIHLVYTWWIRDYGSVVINTGDSHRDSSCSSLWRCSIIHSNNLEEKINIAMSVISIDPKQSLALSSSHNSYKIS